MKNAIVMMFDSLQWDYVGCYGNDWIKTPNMDRLAKEGVLFENAYTEGVPTVPCRRAMHTGRYTLPVSGWVALSMQDTTIADLCWGRPIDTALIFDCPMYRLPKFGYTRGFDKVWFTHGSEGDTYYYDQDPVYHDDIDNYIEEDCRAGYLARVGEAAMKGSDSELYGYLVQMQYWHGKEDRYVAKTIRKAIEYLRQVDRSKQFFLWIDSFDPHEPWNPPSVYLKYPCPYDPDYKGKDQFLPYIELVEGIFTEEQMHHIRMLYAELVTLCDEYLGVLMEEMRRLGLEENTLLLMVSDHGEPMGNGRHGHGVMRKCRPWPYQELVHIPVILRAPGVKAGQRIKAFIQSVDVAPTVCDWLGIGVHPAMQGKSLLPLARGEVEKLRDFAIAGYNKYSWAIYTEDWSYIHWVKANVDTTDMSLNFYGAGMDTSHLQAVGGKAQTSQHMNGLEDAQKGNLKNETGSEVEARHKATLTLDGEEQWTCTPGSKAEVPDYDELYDIHSDPFQLNNVISDYPDVAAGLLKKLTAYIEDLQNS